MIRRRLGVTGIVIKIEKKPRERSISRCLINKDTVAKIEQTTNEVHCLIKADTVAHGKNHEPKHSK